MGTLLRDIIDDFSAETRADLTFIQLLGQVVNSSKRKQPLIQHAADKFNAKSLTFPAPLYAIDPRLVKKFSKNLIINILKNIFHNLIWYLQVLVPCNHWNQDNFYGLLR